MNFPQLPSSLILIVLIIGGLSLIQSQRIKNTSNIKIQPIATPSLPPSKLPVKVTPTPLDTPASKPEVNINIDSPQNTSNTDGGVSDFIYPNSVKIEERTYETSDSPNEVTNWYKEKIKSSGMNTTSFVTTSTNGNVLNKLVGSNGNMEIRIEISRSPSEVKTRIKIN